MNTIVQGKNVNVECLVDGDYIIIGCAFSCSFTFTNELILKTDVNAGLFRKRRVRISDCSGSVQGVIITESSGTRLSIFRFLQESIRRTTLSLRFSYQNDAGDYTRITGDFLVETIDLTAETTAFAEFDMQLQGTGGIDISDIGTAALACDEFFSDWWETTPGATSISGLSQSGLSFAGHDVIEVDREGVQYDLIDTGIPGNRQAKYTGSTAISFEPGSTFNSGERVFVIWLDDAS